MFILDWRLDYQIKSKSIAKTNEPVYIVRCNIYEKKKKDFFSIFPKFYF